MTAAERSSAPASSGYALEAWRDLGAQVQVAERSLFVIDSGAGRPHQPVVLLIHGFPTASWDWHRQWDVLRGHFRLIAFDMLGFGFSEKPAHHVYSIHEQADLAEALLRQLGVGRYSVLAHDYGDTVAQELLARDTRSARHQIRGVCLLNGGLFPESHRARLAQKLLVGPLGGVFVRLFGRRTLKRNLDKVFGTDTPPTAEELDNFWQLIEQRNGQRNMHRLMGYIKDRRVHRERWIKALTDTSAKLMLINGSSDPVSGAHMVKRYRELVGRGDIIELPGIGHYPQLEAPEAVTEHALSFFLSLGEHT